MAKKADAVIRFRFRSDNQSKTAVTESVRSVATDFASVLVNQVVIAASDKAFASAKTQLTNKVRSAVSKEVVQMAYMVDKFLVQPHNATGPSGTVKAFDPVASEQATKFGPNWYRTLSGYQLQSAGISWKKRTFNYLMWKGKKVGHENWWDLSGKLHGKLRKTDFYYQNFGPVSVQFVRNKDAESRGKDVTATGRGRLSAVAHVGTIIVSALGRISPDMLPALATGDPKNAFAGSGSLLPSLISDSEIRNRLTGRNSYRPVLEPFLAYYLTRAIPNAVYKQTERLVDVGSGSNFLKGNGIAGDGEYSLGR